MLPGLLRSARWFLPLVVGLTVGACHLTAQPTTTPLLYGEVATAQDVIVFTLHDRLWEVPLGGGDARALPIPGTELRFPVLSPDGRWLAFSRAGALWVYDRQSGSSKRLTWHPRLSIPRAWSSDGRRILFTAARDGIGSTRAYEVAVTGGVERRLPFYPVRFAAYEPNGGRLAIVGRSHFAMGIDRRYYRGGNRDPLLIVREGSRTPQIAASASTNLVQPMWTPQGLFVLTDSLGSFNLARVETAQRRLRLLTTFRRDGVTAAAASPQAIVLVRDGKLLRVSPETGVVRTVPVNLPALAEESPRQAPLFRYAASVTPGLAGRLLAIEARGDVFTFDAQRQRLTRLTSSPDVADRGPVLSPDGEKIAFFSDSGGEYALVVARARDGLPTHHITLAPAPAYSRELTWSPDGRRLAFSDLRLRLWVADLTTGGAEVADSSRWVAQGLWQSRWSPDSRYLVYAKAAEYGLRSVWMRDLGRSAVRQLTATGNDDSWPVFSPDGRTVYFASSTFAGNAYARDIWALESDLAAQAMTTHRLMAVSPSEVGARPTPLPFGGRSILQMWPRPDGRLLLQVLVFPADGSVRRASSELLEVQPESGGTRRVAEGLRGVEVSSDGLAALLSRPDGLSVVSLDSVVGEPRAAPTAIALSGVAIGVNPVAERPQLFDEAMRMMRDLFYDPALHGESWRVLRDHYASYLPGLRSRGELNELLVRAFGEVSVSHLDVFGGDVPRTVGDTAPAGLLGVDVEVHQNRFRISRVYDPAPRATPGFDGASSAGAGAAGLRSGEFVLSVDGVEVYADRPFESYFVGSAGRAVTLRVSPLPAAGDVRELRAVPMEDDGDLRRRAWADDNAQYVAARSRGRIAYVYIAEWNETGLAEFYRAFNSLREGQGLVIDQRWNTGGITPDGVISALARRPLLAYQFRYGADLPVPLHRVTGSTVLLVNEGNGSAAETFALMFRQQRLGPIVGRTTGGAGIGVSLFSPRLIDGGRVAIPNRAVYSPTTGRWTVENEGIRPELRADWPVVESGRNDDAQLALAVEVAMRGAPRQTGGRSPVPPRHPERGRP